MTRRNFIALADEIRLHNNRANYGSEQHFTDDQLESLASFCKSQNSRFDRELWLDYIEGKCGPHGGSVEHRRHCTTNRDGDEAACVCDNFANVS